MAHRPVADGDFQIIIDLDDRGQAIEERVQTVERCNIWQLPEAPLPASRFERHRHALMAAKRLLRLERAVIISGILTMLIIFWLAFKK